MESHVVEPVQRSLELVAASVDAIAILACLESLLALVVSLVAGIYRLSVAAKGEMTIDDGVLALKVRLVEVVCVPNIRTALAGIHDEGRVGTNEHGHASSSTSGAGSTLLVKRNISCDDDSVAAVPGRRLDPVDRVEKGVCSSVACIHSVDTLNVVVARFFEQLHEDGLDRLGLVKQRLRADLEAANVLGVDVVFLEERGDGSQGERVNVWRRKISLVSRNEYCQTAGMVQLTLAVVAEGHLGLAETNSVLACGDSIELLELSLVNALQRDWLAGVAAIWTHDGARTPVACARSGSSVPGWESRVQWL